MSEAYIQKHHLLASDSLWRHYRRDHSIKGRRENTSSTSSSEACVRSMAPRLEDAVSRSLLSGNHGYIRNPRRSLLRELRTASSRGRYGERHNHAAMLRGVQAKHKRRALSTNSTRLRELPLGWLDGCQWHYPLRPKTRAAYPETYLLRAGTPGPRVELEGLES